MLPFWIEVTELVTAALVLAAAADFLKKLSGRRGLGIPCVVSETKVGNPVAYIPLNWEKS